MRYAVPALIAATLSSASLANSVQAQPAIPAVVAIGTRAAEPRSFPLVSGDRTLAPVILSYQIYPDPKAPGRTIVELSNTSPEFGIPGSFGCADRLAPVFYLPRYLPAGGVELFVASMQIGTQASQGADCAQKPKYSVKIGLDGLHTKDDVRVAFLYDGLKRGGAAPAQEGPVNLPETADRVDLIQATVTGYQTFVPQPIPGVVIDRLPGGFEINAAFTPSSCAALLGPFFTYNQMPRESVNGVQPAAEIFLSAAAVHEAGAPSCDHLPPVPVTLPSMGFLEQAEASGVRVMALDHTAPPELAGYEAPRTAGTKVVMQLDAADDELPMTFLGTETLTLGTFSSFNRSICYIPHFAQQKLDGASVDGLKDAFARLVGILNRSPDFLAFAAQIADKRPEDIKIQALSRGSFGDTAALIYELDFGSSRMMLPCSVQGL